MFSFGPDNEKGFGKVEFDNQVRQFYQKKLLEQQKPELPKTVNDKDEAEDRPTHLIKEINYIIMSEFNEVNN